jgi:xylan 1,4-beta-xylosidase
VEIRLVLSDGHWTSTARGPDVVVAGLSGPDRFTELGRVDGRYLSTDVAGGITGRMVGVAVADGRVRVRSFTYTGSDVPLPDPPSGTGRAA